jgi:uncharacterized glyoxalase superfamily protein PhnB
MVIVKATDSSEAGAMPSEELMAAMGKFNEELFQAGIMKSGDGLKPSREGLRVRFSGTNRTVINGPFAETKELIAGYWLWEVDSMQQAIDWVKRCPNPMPEDSEIEIRPFYEMEDFASVDPAGKMAKQEGLLREKISMQESTIQPYLFFSGRCEEAMAFYEQTLGAKILMKMRFNESPEPVPEGMLQAGFEHKIMHATLTIGTMTIMASDGCDDKSKFDGFRLALSVPTESMADFAFKGLAEGGTVDMPLVKTFWSPRYGMVTDKFGVAWMVMVPGEMS